VRVRPLITLSGQAPIFVVSAFAQKIVEIEKGKRNYFTGWKLRGKKRFYRCQGCCQGVFSANGKRRICEVYNIGSGVSYKISQILEMLLSFSSAKITINVDKSLFRPIDDPELVCDPLKINKLTGWNRKSQ